MSGELLINQPLVSVDWLWQNFDAKNLIILDASIPKVSQNNSDQTAKSGDKNIHLNKQIKNARFFDLKMHFSDVSAEFPNTMPSPKKFSESSQNLGINKDSAIVVYDDLGIYSSPRIWWMFKSMGHHNIAVLDGGLPEWKKAGLPFENKTLYTGNEGDFTGNYQKDYLRNHKEVLKAIDMDTIGILDARSENRFNGTEPEPREGLRSGHIPNSINLPYTKLMVGHKMKSRENLVDTFNELIKKENALIFTCGSGITACILALGAELAGRHNSSVYDGSWTEWGSLPYLPIEKQ